MTQELHYNQIPIDFGFFTRKTYDNFVIGSNEKLFDTLSCINDSDQLVLIYGSKYSGKTHICEAAVNHFKNKSIFINAHTDPFKLELSDSYDLLVIDDLDKLILCKENEETLFSLINNQILQKKPSIVASSKDISECNINLKDLSSRLLSDKIFNIIELDDSDKIDMMISFCSQRGLEIEEKVLQYIIKNCSRDLYFLCALIQNLDTASMSTKRKITIPFIKKVIELRKV